MLLRIKQVLERLYMKSSTSLRTVSTRTVDHQLHLQLFSVNLGVRNLQHSCKDLICFAKCSISKLGLCRISGNFFTGVGTIIDVRIENKRPRMYSAFLVTIKDHNLL